MNTLLLDQTTWDLCKDASGNIAMATGPYALAQDAASAIKTLLGELWYNTADGVPYFQQMLGKDVSLNLVRLRLQQAALTVPGVVKAVVTISAFIDREITGQVQIFDSTDATAVSGF